METSLEILRHAKPAYLGYDTRFLVGWPEHLGGGELTIDLEGTMTLVPLLGTA